MNSKKYPTSVDLLVYLWPNFHIYENIGPIIGQKTFNFSHHEPSIHQYLLFLKTTEFKV